MMMEIIIGNKNIIIIIVSKKLSIYKNTKPAQKSWFFFVRLCGQTEERLYTKRTYKKHNAIYKKNQNVETF
jgi:hypothetical protein